MKAFQIAGYGITRTGLTLGISKRVISATQKEAQTQVMNEALRDGLTGIRINYVREVKS